MMRRLLVNWCKIVRPISMSWNGEISALMTLIPDQKN